MFWGWNWSPEFVWAVLYGLSVLEQGTIELWSVSNLKVKMTGWYITGYIVPCKVFFALIFLGSDWKQQPQLVSRFLWCFLLQGITNPMSVSGESLDMGDISMVEFHFMALCFRWLSKVCYSFLGQGIWESQSVAGKVDMADNVSQRYLNNFCTAVKFLKSSFNSFQMTNFRLPNWMTLQKSILNWLKYVKKFSKWVENAVGKGEIAH